MSGWGPRRRFWRQATARPATGGFAVDLDARTLRTPAGSPLVLPTAALADAVAAEWNGVGDEIDPGLLPLTRAANSAIDRVAPQPGPVIETIAAYGASDLVCYRAERPQGLVARQAQAWDPWLAWSAAALGAPLATITGVMPEVQPPDSLAALRDAVAAHDAFALTALHELVSFAGSLVLGLAVSRRALDPESAWQLSRVDEAWQAEQWGADAEAEAAAEHRRAAFLRAASMLDMLRAADRGPLIH